MLGAPSAELHYGAECITHHTLPIEAACQLTRPPLLPPSPRVTPCLPGGSLLFATYPPPPPPPPPPRSSPWPPHPPPPQVVTPFLPGDSLLFATGALGALGKLSLPILLAIYITSATLGDAVNYASGWWGVTFEAAAGL